VAQFRCHSGGGESGPGLLIGLPSGISRRPDDFNPVHHAIPLLPPIHELPRHNKKSGESGAFLLILLPAPAKDNFFPVNILLVR
jgi:hypothetical protein